MPVDRHAVEDFLYREARLLDEYRYDEWEALWTDDATYWIPGNDEGVDAEREINILYEDRALLHRRLQRLRSELVWALEPRPRLSRIISNIHAEDSQNGEFTVYSSFNLTKWRRGLQETWAGKLIHKLRPENGAIKLTHKKVMLVNNEGSLPVLQFFF